MRALPLLFAVAACSSDGGSRPDGHVSTPPGALGMNDVEIDARYPAAMP